MIPILIYTNAQYTVGSLRILFDGTDIDQDYVMELTQYAESFNTQFKLGSTICRTFSLKIDKRGVTSHPSKVVIKYKSETYATLYVDDIDDSNDFYYTYSLTDAMVLMNKEFDYDTETPHSVKALVETICTNHSISLVTTSFYLEDMMVSWGLDGMTERDFISYVAEVNGGYAYINADGNLVIQTYSNESVEEVNGKACSSIKIGTHHLIDRVYVELAEATHYYPETTTNETVYLNSDNILLTDSGVYTIDGIVQHIQETITGFDFYNIEIEQCPLTDAKCGDLISINVNGTLYKTIVQVSYSYNNGWMGGYCLELESASQEETQIIDSTKKAVKEMKIVVDRELGTIKQRITDDEGDISQIVQDAEGITGTFANYKGVKYIKANTDGITISSSDETSPTELNLDNDGVFVKDANGNEVAGMEENTFRTSEWMMTQTKDNTVFNIFRRWGDD